MAAGGHEDCAAAQPAAPLGRIREYVRRLREKNPHTAVDSAWRATEPAFGAGLGR